MGGRPERPGAPRASLRAALVLALALAPAVGRAADPGEAPSAGGTAAPARPPSEPPYGSSDLDRLRAETSSPEAHRAEPSDPDFGAGTRDPAALRGRARPLGEVSHPPRGRAPGEREEEAAPAGPAPLRLRRRPDAAATAGLGLAERVCVAARDAAHERDEQRQALRAYKRARRDEYPRGGARALVVEHRDIATRRLERAEAELARLLAEARAQDVDPASLPCRRALEAPG